jgi:hypothetical protein
VRDLLCSQADWSWVLLQLAMIAFDGVTRLEPGVTLTIVLPTGVGVMRRP